MLISHPKEANVSEKKRITHLFNVANLSTIAIDQQKINTTLISNNELKRLSFLIGIFHDIGKATKWFQKYIRQQQKSSIYTHHSLVSAIIGYYGVLQEFNEKWAYMAFKIISSHHTNLSSYENNTTYNNFPIVAQQILNILNNSFDELHTFFKDFNVDLGFIKQINLDDFKEILMDSDDLILGLSECSDEDSIEFFFINNYLFSLLIDYDKLDAARIYNDYFEGNLAEEAIDVFKYIDFCRENDPIKFSKEKPINKLRNRFLNDIKNNKNINPDNHFYSITAPTGIGKTFGCMLFANILKKQLSTNSGRIIYALPFTSIIDQNFKEFEKIISYNIKDNYNNRPNRYLLKHHYLTPPEIRNRITDINENSKSLKDYLDDKLLVENWQSSIVVTTYVQLLHTVFGFTNKFLKKFHNISNSIIILDEVQNINPDYHLLIQKAFNVLAKVFNIYFLQITATQPNIIDKEKVVELVNSDYFMKHEVFNRIKLHIDFNRTSLEKFAENFSTSFKKKSCLIVMNTKTYAKQLYELIIDNLKDYYVYCLTTNLTPKHRIEKIEDIKNKVENGEKIIVISTQLIEAGVDFSFEYVYRDFGPIDSIIQVAGRCNRNGEYGLVGGVFNLINLSNDRIYSKILMQYTRNVLKQNEYNSEDFINLTQEYFKQFSFSTISKKIITAIKEMNYDKKMENQIPIAEFRLIEEQSKTNIYILHTKESEIKMNRFVELKRELFNISNKKDKDNKILEIESLKNYLMQFRISVFPYELNKYKNKIEPQEELLHNSDYPYCYLVRPEKVRKLLKNILTTLSILCILLP